MPELTEAEALLVLAATALNQIRNQKVYVDPFEGVKNTYDIASLIDKYFRRQHDSLPLPLMQPAAAALKR